MPPKTDTRKVQAEKVDALLKRIETGTKEVFTSERYMNFLRTMSKFHQYSFRNCLLIAMQKPDATLVAEFRAWSTKFQRHVKKGEKGIQILGYAPYKKEVTVALKDDAGNIQYGKDGNPIMTIEEHTIPRYRPVYVYDVSQTDGKELPQIAAELQGSVRNYENLMTILRQISPFPIIIDDLVGCSQDTHGYCNSLTQEVHVRHGMSEIQTVKTSIHEVAYAILHAPECDLPPEEKTDRATREVQAESIAFIICDYFGIDTSDYTFDYLTTWSSDRELKELQNSLTVIQKIACQLIESIDVEMEQLRLNEIKHTPSVHSLANRIEAAKKTADLFNSSSTEHLPHDYQPKREEAI